MFATWCGGVMRGGLQIHKKCLPLHLPNSNNEKICEMRNAVIKGIEAYLPEYVLTNQELTTMMDTSDEWITTRTGIKERRILKGEALGTSYMGAKAVEKLLQSTGTNPEEIDTVICATVTPDMPFPATANIISDKCHILNAWGYDINAGCSGFIFSFATIASMIKAGTARKVVLVCGEKMSSIVDYGDRTTAPLFGDAAVAMLIEASDDDNGLIDCDMHVDGVGRRFLYQKAGGSKYPATMETVAEHAHYIFQEGRTVFRYAVTNMGNTTQTVMSRNGLTMDNVDFFIPHQANIRIIQAIQQQLNLPDEKLLINIDRFGNTAGTSIPLVLWNYKERFRKGDNILMSAFGAGFTWGALYYKWGI